MSSRFPNWILVALICGIFVVQTIAVYWHLYFYIWWLDIPMHILGGSWVAFIGLTAYYNSPRISEKDHSLAVVLALAVAATLTVGLFWEVYEFGVNHAVGDTGTGLADTLKDLTDDLIGALLAGWIFVRFGYNRKQ